jgi:hypothetical protein
MKKLLALMVMLVALSCVAAGVAVAPASGEGVPTVQFAVEYEAFPGGPLIACKGQRIVTTGPNASVRDRETCHLNDQTLIDEGTYPIVPMADVDFPNNVGWSSDYELFVNPGGVFLDAVSGTLVVKNRPDGTQVWQVHATY